MTAKLREMRQIAASAGLDLPQSVGWVDLAKVLELAAGADEGETKESAAEVLKEWLTEGDEQDDHVER